MENGDLHNSIPQPLTSSPQAQGGKVIKSNRQRQCSVDETQKEINARSSRASFVSHPKETSEGSRREIAGGPRLYESDLILLQV